MTTQWSYSHTQLALWKLCKRRYYNKYLLGKEEPRTPNMAAGTWLCQNPIEELYENGLGLFNDVYWESVWANFLAEFGGDSTFDDPIFTINLAKQILAAYKANPVQGKVIEIEKCFIYELGEGLQYISIPDLVVEKRRDPILLGGFEHPFHRTTWDIKLKTFTQRYAGDTLYANAPLSPFDDQCLGQAICSDSCRFGHIQFFIGKKDGVLIGPVYQEHTVSDIFKAEWILETEAEIREIECWKRSPKTYPWPKNDQACRAYGKSCHYLNNCRFGF